jgi:hypothetical protein
MCSTKEFPMKRSIQFLICSLAAAGFLLAGCNRDDGNGGGGGGPAPAPSGSPTAENVYGGEDMKDEFSQRYGGGNYYVLNHGGRASGLANGGERLSINPDSSYYLVVTDADIKSGDTRVKCSFNERGMITHVRRIKDSPESVVLGSTTLQPADVEAAIVLQPGSTEVTKAETFVQGEVKENQLTESDVQSACVRKDARIVLIEEFFPDAFLLSSARIQGDTETDNQGNAVTQGQATQPGQTVAQGQVGQGQLQAQGQVQSQNQQTPTQTQRGGTLQGQAQIGDTKLQAQLGLQTVTTRPIPSFFLDERLVVRQGVEWVWITGNAARRAVEESSKVFTGGTKGLEVEGDKVQSLESKEGDKNVLGRLAFSGDNDLQIEFGTAAVGRFLPLMQVTGKLLGVSYNPSKGDVAYNLENYSVVPVQNRLQDLGMNKEIEKTLLNAEKDIQPHHKKLAPNGNNANKLLMIDLNVKETDRVKIRSKPRPAAPLPTQARAPVTL